MGEKFEPKIRLEKEQTKEISEKSKKEKEEKEIEMIEKSPLFYPAKKDLALTYLKEKPASWIDISERYNRAEEKENEILKRNRLELEKDEIRQMLDKTGFIYEIKKIKTKERTTYNGTTYNAGYDFIVGRNSESLSRLKRALKKGDKKRDRISPGLSGNCC